MQQAVQRGVMILPRDSEYSAIFQCLAGERDHLHKIQADRQSGGWLLRVFTAAVMMLL